jgi:hypothetical protein
MDPIICDLHTAFDAKSRIFERCKERVIGETAGCSRMKPIIPAVDDG